MHHIERWLAALLAAALLASGGATAEGLVSWFLGGKDGEGTGWDDWETGAAASSLSPEASGWDNWEITLPETTPAPLSAGLNWYDEGGMTVAPEPSPTTDDRVPASAIEDDGMLRVSLRSLDSPQALNLTLEGIYAVEGDRGFRFDRGTQLTLTLTDGDIWLAVGGLNLDMGPALTLTRHLDGWGEAGGLYIEESEKPNLYCGDLSVSAGTNGLQAILTLHVEDYLKGVVAYEMSDSFPIEALKAQAVAARTYALRHKGLSQKRKYDVVDTTADQVYKGFDPAYTNVIAAVDETRGVVGTWEGNFANCYYTASNGGQTALASQLWGDDSDDAYLTMREDPYDLENPRSLENDLTFSARCEGSIKLKQMLTTALKPVMEEAGYSEGQWEFDRIADIAPTNPRFEGSELYDGLAFDLKVRVAESAMSTATPEPSATPSATPEMDEAPTPEKWVTPEETFRVVLKVFDDVKDGLSMGLNGADCELISVEKPRGDTFRLVMRRFGHGVGMSQRGAQTMAGSHEMNYVEILNFYYPGMTLERIAWPESPVKALDEQAKPLGASRPRPTPLPTPAPLPALKDGERYATVDATTLNLRQRPTTASPVEDVYEQGRRVIITGEPDADGWVPCRTVESSGYVKAEYLDIVEAEE